MRRFPLVLTVVLTTGTALTAEAGEFFLARLGRGVGLRQSYQVAQAEPAALQAPEAQPTPSDVPAAPGETAPTPVPETPPAYAPPGAVVGQPVPLYCNVRVKDRRRVHPCAVPTVVCVADPCNPCCKVYVEVCAPPCECVCVNTRWQGRKTEFDYGNYQIEVTSFRSGQILVDYDN